MSKKYWVSKLCGIYKITNELDGKIYIGQSVDIMSRWKNHTNLTKGKKSTLLQSDMIKLGIEKFSFTILELCPLHLLNEREKMWIDTLGKENILYNKTKGGGAVRTNKKNTKKNIDALMIALEPLGKTLNQVFRELETHIKGSLDDKSLQALGIDDTLYMRWKEARGEVISDNPGDMSQTKIEKVTQVHQQSENS